jgi:hypothetical protein
MLPECAVLLGIITAIIAAGVPVIARAFSKANDERHKISDRQIITETKLNMLLHHAGFDIPKVNKAIKEHKEELEELQNNGSPNIGCINIKDLYRNKE